MVFFRHTFRVHNAFMVLVEKNFFTHGEVYLSTPPGSHLVPKAPAVVTFCQRADGLVRQYEAEHPELRFGGWNRYPHGVPWSIYTYQTQYPLDPEGLPLDLNDSLPMAEALSAYLISWGVLELPHSLLSVITSPENLPAREEPAVATLSDFASISLPASRIPPLPVR